MDEARKFVDELYEYIKDRHNVHGTIKSLTVKIKKVLGDVEREKRLGGTTTPLVVLKTPVLNATPRLAKRKKTSPELPRESAKKQKDHHKSPAKKENGKKPEDMEWETVGGRSDQEKKKKKPKTVKLKADALIVAMDSQESYADVLRKVKGEPTLKELGDKVARIRRTQKGELLFELKRDPSTKSSAFKELMEKALGVEARVRALSHEAVIECRNMDEITSVDELREALKVQFELGEAAESLDIRTWKSYGNMQSASIRLPGSVANKLLEVGKVKVGWTVCTLKITEQPERCFKCMGFGHRAAKCQGPDRSDLCRRCGEKGHIAKGCTKKPKCVLCTDQEGRDHPTGCAKCPAFKMAVAGKKKCR